MNRITRMYRIYVDHDLHSGSSIELAGDVFHYLINVLRLRVDCDVILFNGRQGEFCARIAEIKKRSVFVSVHKMMREQTDLPSLSLAMPALRPSRMGFVFEKICEIGATDFYPIICERSQYNWGAFEKAVRQITEAAEQCERLSLVKIHEITSLELFLSSFNGFIFWAYERSDILNSNSNAEKSPKSIKTPKSLLIGPEGGFSDKEISILKSTPSVIEISLGENILRSETAAIVGLYEISRGCSVCQL